MVLLGLNRNYGKEVLYRVPCLSWSLNWVPPPPPPQASVDNFRDFLVSTAQPNGQSRASCWWQLHSILLKYLFLREVHLPKWVQQMQCLTSVANTWLSSQSCTKFDCCESYCPLFWLQNLKRLKLGISTDVGTFFKKLLKCKVIWTRERLEHGWWIIPKEFWRIFDSNALVDFFHL